MATRIMTAGLTRSDHFVAWAMIAGLALALVQSAQSFALPAHFV